MNIRPRDLHRHTTDVYLGTKSISTDVYLEPNQPPQMSAWEPEREQENEVRQPELEAPLTKRQLKRRRNKDSKLDSLAWMQRSAI